MTLKEVTCCNCGIVFGISAGRIARLRETHNWFYCPNGHQQQYVADTDAEREKKRADQLAERLDHARSQRQATERRLLTERQQHGKTKAKVARMREDTCPECGEQFPASLLTAHMDVAHPNPATVATMAKVSAD